VLPFVDMSEKKDQEYFSDGLSEELIDLLGANRRSEGHRQNVLVFVQGQANEDEAFKWLDRAVENGEAQPRLMRSDRDLRSLRADQRFDALLRKMNLL
jgi:hypothetical protein